MRSIPALLVVLLAGSLWAQPVGAEDVTLGDAGTSDVSDAAEGSDATADADATTDAATDTDVTPDADAADAAADAASDDAADAADAALDVAADAESDALDDVSADATADAVADAESDATADAAADALTDAVTDSGADVEADAALDVTDPGPDTTDAGTDVGVVVQPLPTGDASLTGVVRLRGSSAPLPVELTVNNYTGAALSAVAGTPFAWNELPRLALTVEVSAEGYRTFQTQVTPPASDLEWVLYPATAVAVTGRVVDGLGQPAAGAQVSFEGLDALAGASLASTTDADGRFVLPAVDAGWWSVEVVGQGGRFDQPRREFLYAADLAIVLVPNETAIPFTEEGCAATGRQPASWLGWGLLALAIASRRRRPC
jgi:uncharacterized protein (TIGR03382 family)